MRDEKQESGVRIQNEEAETTPTDFLSFWLLTPGFWILLFIHPYLLISAMSVAALFWSSVLSVLYSSMAPLLLPIETYVRPR
jgi:hypothetical protein